MKKIIPYILIAFVIFVGAFGLATSANADAQRYGCYTASGTPDSTKTTPEQCTSPNVWYGTPPAAATSESALEGAIPGCAFITGDFDDCLVKIAYYLFYSIPSLLLGISASLLNLLLSISLSSKLYTGSGFIPDAWVIVRDMSNVFFILILLYAAVKTILDLGHDSKKIIGTVIIMALLINFSMFFTKIIIDSSNILALVFYNKINVEATVKNGTTTTNRAYLPISNSAKTGNVEKDIAGGLASSFKPGEMLSSEFFDKAKTKTQILSGSMAGAAAYVGGGALAGSFIPVVGTALGAGIGAAGYLVQLFIPSDSVPNSLLLGIILISGLIMLFAAYSFFIAGISFVARMIELWLLIIFSPFAFMSSSLPLLSGIPGIGWREWLKRLLSVAFMAPIFMFFLYLIFKLVPLDVFGDIATREYQDQGTFEAITLLCIKAIVILILLTKATSYAKKASGELGDALIKGTAVAMGIAGGVAIGGAAAGLQGTLGHLGKIAYESTTLTGMATSKKTGWRGGLERFAGSKLRTIGGGDDGKGGLAGSSFDARKGVMGGLLRVAGGASGLSLGGSSKLWMKEAGGYEADLKRRDEVRKRRAEGLETKEGEPEKQALNNAEEEKESLAEVGSHEMKQIDTRIESALKDSSAKSTKANAIHTEDPQKVEERKKKIKEARDMTIDANNPNEIAKKNLAIKEAETMDVDDEDKVKLKNDAIKAAREAAEYVVTLRAQKSTIGNANADNMDEIKAKVEKANQDLMDAETEGASEVEKNKLKQAINAAKVAVEVAKLAQEIKSAGGTGASINELGDNIIPDLKHTVDYIGKGRARDFATNLENQWAFPWNKAERKKSAHAIRMDVKSESGKDKGGGHGGAEHLGSDILAAAIVSKVSDHGHDSSNPATGKK